VSGYLPSLCCLYASSSQIVRVVHVVEVYVIQFSAPLCVEPVVEDVITGRHLRYCSMLKTQNSPYRGARHIKLKPKFKFLLIAVSV